MSFSSPPTTMRNVKLIQVVLLWMLHDVGDEASRAYVDVHPTVQRARFTMMTTAVNSMLGSLLFSFQNLNFDPGNALLFLVNGVMGGTAPEDANTFLLNFCLPIANVLNPEEQEATPQMVRHMCRMLDFLHGYGLINHWDSEDIGLQLAALIQTERDLAFDEHLSTGEDVVLFVFTLTDAMITTMLDSLRGDADNDDYAHWFSGSYDLFLNWYRNQLERRFPSIITGRLEDDLRKVSATMQLMMLFAGMSIKRFATIEMKKGFPIELILLIMSFVEHANEPCVTGRMTFLEHFKGAPVISTDNEERGTIHGCWHYSQVSCNNIYEVQINENNVMRTFVAFKLRLLTSEEEEE